MKWIDQVKNRPAEEEVFQPQVAAAGITAMVEVQGFRV